MGQEHTTNATADEKPQRLSLSRLVELQLAALARVSGEHSTVKLARNAKGETQIEISVRTGEGDVDTADQAAAKACTLYDELAERYTPSVETLEQLLAAALERRAQTDPEANPS